MKKNKLPEKFLIFGMGLTTGYLLFDEEGRKVLAPLLKIVKEEVKKKDGKK